MSTLIGKRVGHYKLLRLIGRGGYADVYLGKHIRLKTLRAIKVLKNSLTPELCQQFEREARLAASLQHDNIVGIHDYGIYNGTPYLVMQLASKGSLRQQYTRGTLLSFLLMLEYLEQIADALDYMHAKGLIHLDIKPENLLLGENGKVLLSDFSITELSRQGFTQRAGTPSYMAPEQIIGHATTASDQYSLAIVVHEWMTGRLPFQGTPEQIYQQQLRAYPRSMCAQFSDITPEMERVVFKALEKDPSRRYSTVRAFVQELRLAMTPALLPDNSSEETLPFKEYILKLETWEDASKFFITKMFVAAMIGFLAFLRSNNTDVAFYFFGLCILFMPPVGIFRRRNFPAQMISSGAFIVSIAISIALHSIPAFPLTQASTLTLCIWITFLRKYFSNRSISRLLRSWLDIFRRLIL